jgi:hypothetical protein
VTHMTHMTQVRERRAPESDDYSPSDDLAKAIEFAYEFIRQRVAQGGPGWGGWPRQEGAGRVSGSGAITLRPPHQKRLGGLRAAFLG